MVKQQAAKQAAESAPIPEVPAKQQDMNEIMEALKPAIQADPARFMRTEHQQNVFGYKAMTGSTIEQHLLPEFWLQLGSKLSPLDEIIVREECGAWRAELLVRSIGAEGVDVVVFHYFDIGGVAAVGAKPKLRDGFRITYTGNHELWAVYDGEKQLVANIPTEQAAIIWLESSNCRSTA